MGEIHPEIVKFTPKGVIRVLMHPKMVQNAEISKFSNSIFDSCSNSAVLNYGIDQIHDLLCRNHSLGDEVVSAQKKVGRNTRHGPLLSPGDFALQQNSTWPKKNPI